MAIRLIGRRALLERLSNEMPEDVTEEMEERLDQTIDGLRAATPRDTGRAAEGWRLSPLTRRANGEFTAEISNPVEYISELNEGTSRQAPRRFVEQVAGRYFTQILPIFGRR